MKWLQRLEVVAQANDTLSIRTRIEINQTRLAAGIQTLSKPITPIIRQRILRASSRAVLHLVSSTGGSNSYSIIPITSPSTGGERAAKRARERETKDKKRAKREDYALGRVELKRAIAIMCETHTHRAREREIEIDTWIDIERDIYR